MIMKKYYKFTCHLFLVTIPSLLLMLLLTNGFVIADSKTSYLGYLKYAVKFETKRPYYLKRAKRLFFKEGWDTINHSPRAIDRDAVFEFYIKKKRNIKIYIDIENNNYIRLKRPLFIDVKINGKTIKKIQIDNFFSKFFELPAKYLESGINKLKFTAIGKVPLRLKDSNSFPGVWYILKDLSIENMPDIGDRFVTLNDTKSDAFFQPANSDFTLAIDPLITSEIEFTSSLFNKKNTSGYLTIREKRKGKTKILIKRKVFYGKSFITKLKFNPKEGGFLLEFSFDTSNEDSFLLWKKFSLLKKKGNVVDKKLHITKKIKNLKNIFIIVLDAARYELFGKRVNGIEVMPNINMFSKTSYNFRNYYANAPYTAASVASMFTGLLPEVHTVRGGYNRIPTNLTMIQDYLNEVGFNTYAFTGNPLLLIHNLLRGFNKKKLIYNKKNKWRKSSYNNIEPIINLISKLDNKKKNYMYIHLLPPHNPYNPPNFFERKFHRGKDVENKGFSVYSKDYLDYMYGRYLNNASYGDSLVGEILDSLKKNGLFNDSLIIITADHGEGFGEHNLMWHGKSVYNEMIHLPLFIKSPFQTKKMGVNYYCSQIDLFSIFMEYIDNKNFKDKLQGFIMLNNEQPIYSRALGKVLNATIFFKNYKYIYNSGFEELYSLASDNLESQNSSRVKTFLNLILRQKLFVTYFNNKNKRKKMKIKQIIKKERNNVKVLKTLGYL